ncbi:MAG: hypothetical protein EAZ70_08990 [Runella slithyformis]|jgi:hypothetical protein|nr:MAG: hypothetical protein EAY79_09620 [Runella slithyformis]TAF96507.1 MAG: hypothetical protein EAZ46_04800 [Runella sp.]TAG20727.1 MAG: hypothetical protein EAZ38_09530 [Cytophagales bacterium]TAG39869.1 MAG: hypothetical protein EAZ32_08440 [Cytophagia bacterium]TAE91622.1 MAG: hypothetical protein EAZ80_12520 [Runella slithyformis]
MVFLQFQVSEIAELLKYGISGLSTIAFLLSFFLLNRESGRPKPRPEMLRNIRLFMWVTLILGVLSGVAAILNPSGVEANPPRKASPPKKSALGNLLTTKPTLQIEVFYQIGAKTLAEQVAEELENYKEYKVKMTQLTAQRQKEWNIRRTQIRHEITEKPAAVQLQNRLAKIMPQDVSFYLKQISSSSPNYLSVFVCD